jgi:hypothetical protein
MTDRDIWGNWYKQAATYRVGECGRKPVYCPSGIGLRKLAVLCQGYRCTYEEMGNFLTMVQTGLLPF